MKKLMKFRKDELEVPLPSVEEGEFNFSLSGTEEKLYGLEDCDTLVHHIEEMTKKIANVVRGVDKRMSYNMRLFAST